MWFLIFLLIGFALGGEIKVVYQDGRIGVISEQALKTLKSQVLYTEKPKRLWLKDEVLRSSSIGVWINGQSSYSLPVKAGQTIGFSSINAQVSFSGPCTQAGNLLSCISDGTLSISADSSDGRLILWSETHPLSLLPNSYWLGTSARLSGRTGRGVLVAVVDTGIDLCHPEFEDRIVFFYDAITGLELSQNDIRWKRRNKDCDYDVVGHGTAVAGVLAGKSGIAPEAEIVVVNVADSNGAINDTAVIKAIQYLKNKKQALGKPMVVNLSLGNTYGPADGTGLLDLEIDRSAGSGFIVVAANGNEGNIPIRAVIENENSVSISISLTPNIPFEVWYGGNSSYRVELCDSSGRCAVSQRGQTPTLNLACVNSITHQSYPFNGKVFVDFNHTCSGVYTLSISLISGSPSRVDLFGGFEGNSFGAYTVSDGRGGYLYTVSQPATARNVIAVGAFTSTAFHDLGNIANFSSRGPTVDGRIKPDITAGGNLVYTAWKGENYWFASGTSFSAPAVAGLTALMLEANPNLTPEQVKELLCQNALSDSAVGSTPNNFFGCGKAKAVSEVPLPSGDQAPTTNPQPIVIPPPNESTSGGGGGCSTGGSSYVWSLLLIAILLLTRRLKERLYQ